MNWDDNWFTKDARDYNNDLCYASVGLAASGYNNNGNTEGDKRDYVMKSLEALKFDPNNIDVSSYASRPQNDSTGIGYTKGEWNEVAYAFGYKLITNSNGEIVPLIAVIVRGTPSNAEWKSNGNMADSLFEKLSKDRNKSADEIRQEINNSTYHEGFKEAEKSMRDDFCSYLEKIAKQEAGYGVDFSKSVIYTTGHSRGAAVSNLFAADMNTFTYTPTSNNTSNKTFVFGNNRIFCYSFATPNTTRDKSAHSQQYSNIYSIVNPEDFVARVPFEKWGFTKYGQTLKLPVKCDQEVGTSYEKQHYWSDNIDFVKNNFRFLRNGDSYDYYGGVSALETFEANVMNLASNVYEMYTKPNGKTIETFKDYYDCLVSALVKDMDLLRYATGLIPNIEDDEGAANLVDQLGLALHNNSAYSKVTDFFVDYNNSPNIFGWGMEACVFDAHTSDTYVAWMKALVSNHINLMEIQNTQTSAKNTINCPVDIEVYDSNRRLVAHIVNNTVDKSIDSLNYSLSAYVNPYTGEKVIWIPIQKGYTVEYKATADGVMDISWENYDTEGNVKQVKTYTELPLIEGTSYKASIQNVNDSGFENSYQLDKGGIIISADYSLSGPQLQNLYVHAVAQGNGHVVGVENASKGNHVAVYAYPDDGATFEGWYESGKLVSNNESYIFRIEGSRILEGRFSGGNNPGTESVDMFRMYNHNSGEHLYTSNTRERDKMVRDGWNYEGVMWHAPKSSSTPIYRLYNPTNGDHHYARTKQEYDVLQQKGWTGENVSFYSDDAEGVPIYRLFNPNQLGAGSHHYTDGTRERDVNMSQGWEYEGVGWYGLK